MRGRVAWPATEGSRPCELQAQLHGEQSRPLRIRTADSLHSLAVAPGTMIEQPRRLFHRLCAWHLALRDLPLQPHDLA